MQYLLFSACAFLVLLGVATSRAIYRTRGSRSAVVFLVTRLVTVALLAYLGYQSLGDFRSNAGMVDAGGERRVVLLVDQSASMDFPDGESTRGESVDVCVAEIEKRLNGLDDFELTRVDFADNFVEPQFRSDLRRDASRLGNALTGALTRYRADAVLVVSDGASTDGNPPDYVLDWAKNRALGVYAVGVGGRTGSFDARIAKVEGLRENPDVLTAQVQCRGDDVPDRLVIRLTVDGKPVESKRVKPAPMSSVSFVLPKMTEGWHEYIVDAASPTPETCLANNSRVGVFRKSPPKRILFLYTAPSADYRHLASFLRVLFPGRIDAASVFESRIDDLGPDDVVFLVLGDVAPSNVPVKLMGALKSKRLPALLLPGDNLVGWTRSGVASFPLKSVGAYHSATKLNARIVRPNRAGWGAAEFVSLRPTGFRKAAKTDTAAELLSLETSEGRFPFLVANAPKNAHLMVLLSGSSWRWSLSPESQVRSAFRGLWRRITAMAVAAPDTATTLRFTVDRSRGNTLGLTVRHEDETRTAELKDISLQLGEDSDDGGFVLRDAAWRKTIQAPTASPSITWLKVSATLDGIPLESETTPHVVNPDGAEFVDTIPHHDRMRSLLSNPQKDFATVDGVGRLMGRLVARTQIIPPQEVVRHRDWRMELTIGLIMLLVLCLDWLLERNLKEGR